MWVTVTGMTYGGTQVSGSEARLKNSVVFIPRILSQTDPVATLLFVSDTERDNFIDFVRETHVRRHEKDSVISIQFVYPRRNLGYLVQITQLMKTYSVTIVGPTLKVQMLLLGDQLDETSPVSAELNGQKWWETGALPGDYFGRAHQGVDDANRLRWEQGYMRQPHVDL